jgi:hypothetical protein
MANIFADIKPTGFGQKELVRLLRYCFAALEGIAAKLDNDDNADDTYEADLNLIHSVIITDDLGNYYHNVAAESSSLGPPALIGPYGVSDAALLDILYQLHYCFNDMMVRADADDLTTGDYEALLWTAIIAHRIENRYGAQIGVGYAYTFRPGGVTDQKELVELLFNFLTALTTFSAKLDTDAVPANTNYAELWTDVILLRIENGAGSVVGATSTHLG